MKKFRERNLVVVAAISLVVMVVAALLALNFSKLPLISNQKSYAADFQSAVGLQKGDVVTIAGVRVGAVTGMTIHGNVARVTFTLNGGPRLGQDTTVDEKILNPVGVEYLELTPKGSGTLRGAIPVSRTTIPGTLVSDLDQLTTQTQQTNIPQLVKALEVITQTLQANSPAQTKAAIDGVANLSAVLAARQAEVANLVTQANQLTGLLNSHNAQLVDLLVKSNLILQVLEQRKAAIDNLLATTSQLTAQIDHLIVGDRSVIDPMLSNLQAVSAFLARDSNNVSTAIPLLEAFSRYSANVTGSGPYADFVAPTLVVPDNLIAQCSAIGKIDALRGVPGMTSRLRHLIPWIAVTVVLLIVGSLIGLAVTGSGNTKTIVAQFAEAPGLYPGNHVEVLGIPVGTVTSIKPEARYVLVTMKVRSSLPVPANAAAELMAPQVVADRFVQLIPAYTGGPVLSSGAVIPLSRTVIPQSVDAVISTLNSLAIQLGPNGVNKNGALTDLVHRLAVQFGNTGPDFHSAVVNFSGALHGIAQNSSAVAGTLNNLGDLSQALADNSGTYQSFANSLDAVSQILANDRADLGGVLSSLQQLFANLTNFIQADGGTLGGSIDNLRVFAGALASQQVALAHAYGLSPLALQNLDNTIDKSAPGGPALRGRYNAVASTQTLFNTVCGNPALRFLVLLANGTQSTKPLTAATPVDTLCGIGNALNALTPPPGSNPGPDLSLNALVP